MQHEQRNPSVKSIHSESVLQSSYLLAELKTITKPLLSLLNICAAPSVFISPVVSAFHHLLLGVVRGTVAVIAMRTILLILAYCAVNTPVTWGFGHWYNHWDGRSFTHRNQLLLISRKSDTATTMQIEAQAIQQHQLPKTIHACVNSARTRSTRTDRSIKWSMQQSLLRFEKRVNTCTPSKSQSLVSLQGGSHLNLFLICPGVGCATFSMLVDAFSYAMENHYLATQAITMAIFSGIGDYVAQFLERRRQTMTEAQSEHVSVNTTTLATAFPSTLCHDWTRTIRFMIKGIGCGVVWALWYNINELWSTGIAKAAVLSLSPSPQSVRHLQTILFTVLSIVLEQFIASPLIFGLWDIPLLSLLYGTPIGKIPSVVRKTLIPLLIANAKLWTLVNVLIYNVPLKWRVGALSCAELVWQAILSSIATVATTTTNGEDDEENARQPRMNAAKK